MPDSPQILLLQTNPSLPELPGTTTATDLLLVPTRAADRLNHFPEDVYRLDAESALVRFMKVVLGDAGAGQVRKKYLLRRLQQTFQGTHFFDLDRFYGALFGVQRKQSEVLTVDPYLGTATAEEWEEQHSRDASYRSRIMQFAKAISYGPSPVGMELIAEALLSFDVDIYESFRDVDAGVPGITNRRIFTVRPKRQISEEERYDILRVISRIKPADALALVDADGVPVHSDIQLRGVAADSEFWEVLSKVQPRTVTTKLPYPRIDIDPTEQPRPPFGGYQGEAWNYNSDAVGVVAYYKPSDEIDIASPIQAVTFPAPNTPKGSTFRHGLPAIPFPDPASPRTPNIVQYPPDLAMASALTLLGGRYISDAVYQSHPYGERRLGRTDVYVDQQGQVFALLDTGQVVKLGVNYADKIPIPGLLEALNATTGTPSSVMLSDPVARGRQRFWVTPSRPMESPFKEVLEVRLVAPRWVNYVGFDVSHYPHIAAIEIYNDGNGQWSEVYSTEVSDSSPSQAKLQPTDDRKHPEHPDDSSHWLKTNKKFDAVKTSRIRVVLKRISGTPPKEQRTTSGGGDSVYSPTTTVSFGTGAELNAYVHHIEDNLWPQGVATQYVATDGPAGHSVTYNVPSVSYTPSYSYSYDVAVPYSLALRDLEVGYRVASFYDLPLETATSTDLLGSLVQFEVRQNKASSILGEGGLWKSEPQPVSSAVVNFFADTRDEAGEAQTIDRFFLDPTHAGPHLSIYWSNDALPNGVRADDNDLPFPIVSPTGSITSQGLGLLFDAAAPSHIDIDNRAIQFDPNEGFAAGVAVRTSFAYNEGDHVFFDLGGYVLAQMGGLIQFGHGGNWIAMSVEFPANADLRIVGSRETIETGERLRLLVGYRGEIVSHSIDIMTPASVPPMLRFGGLLDGTSGPASFLLNAFMLKRGPAFPEGFLDTSVLDPYVVRQQVPDPGDPTTNAILRFFPSFISDINELGFRGGPGEFFDYLSWTPVARDYTVQRGLVHVHPTKARFWKFEFTNLVAEPYESFVPIDRITKVFPPGTSEETMWQETNGDPNAGPPGMRADINLGGRLFLENFIDVSSRADATSPTAARYVNDLGMAARMRAQSWTYGFQPWHLGMSAPSFVAEGQHQYEQIEIQHSSKVAFFAGLKSIAAYRVDYLADDDTTQYLERFNDFLHIAPAFTWSLDPHHLFNGAIDDAEAHSKTFESAHDVVGLQFATSQSHPLQIVPNHDLKDPAMAMSDFTDPDDWHALGDARLSYLLHDQSLLIERTGENEAGGEAPPATVSLITTIPSPVFSRDYVTAAEESAAASAFGGVSTPGSITGGLGEIHAAVRFAALTDTHTSPYYLQIVRADTDALLAEKSFSARAGEVVEGYLSYVIGSIAPAGTAVRAQLVQKTKIASRIVLDTLSIFDDGIVWDFSVDGGATWVQAMGKVRNNPNGMVTFPAPGTQLVWRVRSSRENMHVTSLQIRPIYSGLRNYRPAGILHGPNLSTYDQEAPVAEDPEFKAWHRPVPFWWWREARAYQNLPVEGLPVSSEYARFFGRPVEEAVDVAADTGSRFFKAIRGVADTAGGADASSETRFFFRSASESVPAPTDEASGVTVPAGSPLIQHPVHPTDP